MDPGAPRLHDSRVVAGGCFWSFELQLKPEDTATTTFAPGDFTIHCVINLNKAKKGTAVKFSWKASNDSGTASSEFQSIDYTTNSFENIVHAHLTRTTDWPKGKYEVAVEINGAADKTIQFTIE